MHKNQKKWMSEEDDLLKKLYLIDKLRKVDISIKLNRSMSAIQNRIHTLNLHRKKIKYIKNKELYDKIIKIYNSGNFSNNAIAEQLKIDKDTVTRYLAQAGMSSKFYQKTNLLQIDDNTVICNKCGNPTPIIEFQYIRKGLDSEYRLAYCNKCRKKQHYENLNSDVRKFLSNVYNRTKRRSKKLNILFNINKDDFIEQYFNQSGKCFYSDIEMRIKVGDGFDKNALSVDKIIPENGYVKGNVVFCTNRINTAKSDFTLSEIKEYMPKWNDRIEKFLGTFN